MSEAQQSIRNFKPPSTAAGGPAFSCPACQNALHSYEWGRDYTDPSGRALELRCACGQRFHWIRDATAIEIVFNRWYRTHARGHCEVMREPSGVFVYGLRSDRSQKIEWSGLTRSLDEAQQKADALVAAHECRCAGWRGYS